MFIVSNSISEKCPLILPDLSFFAPLVFRPDGVLKTTALNANGMNVVPLDNGEDAILSCAPNYFKKFPQNQFVRAKCLGDQSLGI